MQGFFSRSEVKSESRPSGKSFSCAACGLFRGASTPKMQPFGEFKKGIMIIGESPGEADDEAGRPWQGKAGRILQRALRDRGIDLFEDCVSLNAVNCRPCGDEGKNRPPDPTEIDHCRGVLVSKAIKSYKPSVILLLGGAAVSSVISPQWEEAAGGSISKFRGWCIPDQKLGTWLCPMFHPNFLIKDNADHITTVWEQDLDRALSRLNAPFPVSKKPVIEVVDDLRFLDDIHEGLFALDYETTGLKPHLKGHKIKTASISSNPDHAWVFSMPKTKEGRLPFRRWLVNPKVKKMAHNMKFEETWSAWALKAPVQGWVWDSMQAAHILDNRPGITSLKFQTYVTQGVPDYSLELDGYLKSVEPGGNAFNRIDELLATPRGLDTVFTYNGLDTIYEYRLGLWQMEQMGVTV